MLAATRRIAAAAARAPALHARASAPMLRRGLCDGVHVDMVCRTWTCKVADDATAHQLDCAFEDYLDAAAEAEGCTGASRLVCKTHWDYKLILKFEDADSLKGFMSDYHERLDAAFGPALRDLAVGNEIKEQNWVYDDIE